MAKIQDRHYRRTDRADKDEISFDSDMLRLFLAIDDSKTLWDVSKEVKMSSEVFKTSLIKLIQLKLIEQVEDKPDLVDQSVLAKIRDILVQLMGPLGEVLLTDAAKDLSLEDNKIPAAMAEKFIDCIAQNIPGEKQREEFRRAMLRVMPFNLTQRR